MNNLVIGEKLTIIGVSSWMALTTKSEVQYFGRWDENPKVHKVKFRKKRKMVLMDLDQKLIFKGWDISLKTDSEMYGVEGGTRIMRGNACVNFIGSPDEVRDYVELHNMNHNVNKSNIVAISDLGHDAKEIPVYPELFDGHAVIDKMLRKL